MNDPIVRAKSDPRWQQLADYIALCADGLRLKDWIVVAAFDAPDEGNMASCRAIEGQHFATLRFSDDFFVATTQEQRVTVLHELLHCLLKNCYDVVRSDLHDLGALTQREYDGLCSVYIRQQEYAVDDLAHVLAPFFDLPKLTTDSWPSQV